MSTPGQRTCWSVTKNRPGPQHTWSGLGNKVMLHYSSSGKCFQDTCALLFSVLTSLWGLLRRLGCCALGVLPVANRQTLWGPQPQSRPLREGKDQAKLSRSQIIMVEDAFGAVLIATLAPGEGGKWFHLPGMWWSPACLFSSFFEESGSTSRLRLYWNVPMEQNPTDLSFSGLW